MSENLSRRAALEKLGGDTLKFGSITYACNLLGLAGLGYLINGVDPKPRDPVRFFSERVDYEGARFDLVKARHNILDYSINRELIRDKIAEAPFAIIEYFRKDQRELATNNYTMADLYRAERGKTTTAFFAAVAKDSAELGKDVAVLNPENAFSQLAEVYTLFGLTPGLLLTDFVNIVRKITKKGFDRRNLIRTLGYSIGLAHRGSWISENSLSEALSNERRGLGSTQVEPPSWRYNSVDHRDITCALAIRQIAPVCAGEGVVPVIQGGIHAFGIRKYLNDFSMSETKINLYPQYNVLAEPIKRFRYNRGEDTWERVPFAT